VSPQVMHPVHMAMAAMTLEEVKSQSRWIIEMATHSKLSCAARCGG
jgi:hypothetical protein